MPSTGLAGCRCAAPGVLLVAHRLMGVDAHALRRAFACDSAVSRWSLRRSISAKSSFRRILRRRRRRVESCRHPDRSREQHGSIGYRGAMLLAHTVGDTVWSFNDLKDVLAKATPLRSGDVLAGVAATSAQQRVAARMCLAELPLSTFVDHAVIPYESDDVTRLIVDRHDAAGVRADRAPDDRRLPRLAAARRSTDAATLSRIAPGVMPEMAAAVSKLMRNQDLIAVARKCSASSRAFAARSGCRGACRSACSRIIRPTIRWASRSRCSTA